MKLPPLCCGSAAPARASSSALACRSTAVSPRTERRSTRMQMTILNKAKDASLAAPAASPVCLALTPIMGVVFAAFLVIGLGLPVLPLYVHQGLGFGTFTVGIVTGSQFAASLFSRVWSGRTCDNQGPKYALILGHAAASASGVLYLISLRLAQSPEISV